MIPTYAPNDISVVINYGGASHVISGYMEDTMITFAPNSQRHSMFTSADNKAARVRLGDNSKTLSITLNQTSVSNDVLFAIHQDDVATSEGWFEMFVKDNNGRTFLQSNDCYIVSTPSATFGTTIQPREWSIYIHNPTEYVGGNDAVGPSDVAMLSGLGVTLDSRWTS